MNNFLRKQVLEMKPLYKINKFQQFTDPTTHPLTSRRDERSWTRSTDNERTSVPRRSPVPKREHSNNPNNPFYANLLY